tara:strand:+ start:367 stop:633 length:267 start_codon:yes stop_codon:yes gene_type:complete
MDKRKEKIKYRSWHRGTREADLFLGKFIDKYINDLNEILLTNFEDFINNYSDPEIISFVYGNQPWPEEVREELKYLFECFIKSQKRNN